MKTTDSLINTLKERVLTEKNITDLFIKIKDEQHFKILLAQQKQMKTNLVAVSNAIYYICKNQNVYLLCNTITNEITTFNIELKTIETSSISRKLINEQLNNDLNTILTRTKFKSMLKKNKFDYTLPEPTAIIKPINMFLSDENYIVKQI